MESCDILPWFFKSKISYNIKYHFLSTRVSYIFFLCWGQIKYLTLLRIQRIFRETSEKGDAREILSEQIPPQ